MRSSRKAGRKPNVYHFIHVYVCCVLGQNERAEIKARDASEEKKIRVHVSSSE